MAALAAIIVPALAAQTPRGVSPRLARVLARGDTTVAAWVIARPRTDLAALAAQLQARGARVRHTSRFVNAVSVEVAGNALRGLVSLNGVVRVQPVGVYYRRTGGQADRRTDCTADLSACPPVRLSALADTLYGNNAWAILQLRIDQLHLRGLRGAGVRVAILDAGFNTLHPFMAGATVVAQRDFVYNDSVVRDQPGETPGEMSHGTGTWSLIAANAPGRLFGVAPQAEFLLAKTEYTASETRTEEDNWVAAVEWAIGLNAQIISSSLGYLSFDGGFSYTPAQLTGDIAVTTVAADSAAARGVLVVVSAGNDGPNLRSIGTPADADSVVAVGATDSLRRIAGFSSRGPTADGRFKPEVAAPGVQLNVAAIDSGLGLGSGTSFAAPLVAGLAALVQAGRAQPAVQLRDGLIMAGERFLNPDNNVGYGIPDALKLYGFPRGVHALSPNAAGTLTSVTPTFTWDADVPPPLTAPNVYFLRIWSDSLQQNVVLDTFLTQSFYTIPDALAPGLRLFWRIVASSALGVAESTAVHGPVRVPDWATLLTLASPQGATIRDSLPVFYWESPDVTTGPGPFRYDVDIYPASRTPREAVASARGITDTVFTLTSPLEKNLPFRWRVVAHLGSDSQVVTSPGTFLVADASTPSTTLLFQSFPNPFPNPAVGLFAACIWFDVAQSGEVRLEIFDIRGRMIRRLAPSASVPSSLPAGRYGRPAGDAPGTCDDRFAWDGRDESGSYVRAGVYIYRLSAPGFQDSKRIVFAGPS